MCAYASFWVVALFFMVIWGVMRLCFRLVFLPGSLCSELQRLAWFNKSVFVLKLKMRAGGMSESSKWKKQKRSPRPPRHMVRSPSGQMDTGQSSTLTNNLSGIPTQQVSLIQLVFLSHFLLHYWSKVWVCKILSVFERSLLCYPRLFFFFFK